MKKTVFLALIVLSSSMANASPGDAPSNVAPFDIWEWMSALFDGAAGTVPAAVVKSDGIVYDTVVKSDGIVYDTVVKSDGIIYD